jgi:hypothetical protein
VAVADIQTDLRVTSLRTQIILIVLVLAASVVLELLADTHPFAGIWWTHKQAMELSGIIVAGLGAWMLVGKSD